VIKDRDDHIAELMAEENSDNDSDSDSSPDYEDDDKGAKDEIEEDPREMPLRSMFPS
jgi:hypothetical protein